MEKVAVVTGANRGIGYGIVKGLCQKFDGYVYLTARDEKKGKDALQSIKDLNVCKDNNKLRFHQLDILDNMSILKLHDDIKMEHGGLDILVNNAAVAFKHAATEPFGHQAKVTVGTNFFALVTFCNMIFPLLRPHARVVNMSSSSGLLDNWIDKELKAKFLDETLTEKRLVNLMKDYVHLAEECMEEAVGWLNTAYSASKIALTKLSFIQHAELSKDKKRPDIIVNAVHPGYVNTEMTSHRGPLTIDQGAQSAIYAALLPPNVKEPRGQFVWCDNSIIPWDTKKSDFRKMRSNMTRYKNITIRTI